MPYVEIEKGVNYYYEDRGEGKTVVLVHGWGMSGMVWERQVVDLSDDYRTITFDCRGCGKSDKPKNGYSIAELSKDLKSFLDGLDLKDVILVGWSAGGSIVMDYITRYGDRVEKAVSVGGAVPRYTATDGFDIGAPQQAFQETMTAMKANRATLLRGICDACFHQDIGTPTKEWLFNIFMEQSWFAERTMEDLGQIDLRDKLPHIKIPVAFFHGLHDQVVPYGLSEFSAKQVSGSKLVTFEESSHAPFMEETQKFNDELVSFISS